MSRFLPPSKVLDAEINNSILGDGCVVRAGCKINHSVIGLRTLIGNNVIIDDALIMGCDATTGRRQLILLRNAWETSIQFAYGLLERHARNVVISDVLWDVSSDRMIIKG